MPMAHRNGGWRIAAWRVLEGWHEARYQDAGSLTLLKSTPADRRKAAWLYLQFIVSKTVSWKKSHVGLTFIRDPISGTSRSPSARRSRRLDRVLPLAPRRAVDPTATTFRIIRACSIVVAEHRRCVVRCEDAQAAMDSLAARRIR